MISLILSDVIGNDLSTIASGPTVADPSTFAVAYGVLEKYKNRHVLLRQVYIRDESITIAQLLSQAIRHIGENIVIRRFIRWEICPETEIK